MPDVEIDLTLHLVLKWSRQGARMGIAVLLCIEPLFIPQSHPHKYEINNCPSGHTLNVMHVAHHGSVQVICQRITYQLHEGSVHLDVLALMLFEISEKAAAEVDQLVGIVEGLIRYDHRKVRIAVERTTLKEKLHEQLPFLKTTGIFQTM